MVRAFISIDFENDEVVQNIVKIQNQLRDLDAKLKFVNPKILHITLEFLGEISEEQINQVSSILEELSFPKFLLSVKHPDVLPNEKYIRVIYCNLEGHIEQLKQIQNEIRLKLKKLGFKTDSRPFKPHLTIARVKYVNNKSELIKVINNLSEYTCGEQEIKSVKLKESVLGPTGPEYTTLFEKQSK